MQETSFMPLFPLNIFHARVPRMDIPLVTPSTLHTMKPPPKKHADSLGEPIQDVNRFHPLTNIHEINHDKARGLPS
jgi:hypothetical protein